MMPLISVLMPVYNTEECFLREAVESILQQSFSDFEFVIVNDGSTNNAETVIQSYDDPRIKHLKQTNQGVARALNFGLSCCNGTYVARMDSDDISLPDRLAKQMQYMEAHPEISVLGSAMELFPEKRIISPPETDPEIKAYMTWVGSPLIHPTVFFRRDFFTENGLSYPVCAAEDFTLWVKCKDLCQFHNLRDVLLRYRVHGEQLTRKRVLTLLEETYRLMIPMQERECGFSLKSFYRLKKALSAGGCPALQDVRDFHADFERLQPVCERYPELYDEMKILWELLLRKYRQLPKTIFLDRHINRFFKTPRTKMVKLQLKSFFLRGKSCRCD